MDNLNLDDPQLFEQFDPDGMRFKLREMPEQCQRAWQMATDFSLPQDHRQVNKVVILGMGGSAIAGDLVKSLVAAEARLPILVHRDYDLPAFVDDNTLVFASSYSGMTEETLASFRLALATKAKKLVITTDGQLKTVAQDRGIPTFQFDYRVQPRTALPYSLLPILCFLNKLGLISDRASDVAETVTILQSLVTRINENVNTSENPAKRLAKTLYGHLPVIYGGGLVSEVAHRWKTQINENSKAWAAYEAFPELNHNAVVGYQFPPELAGKIVVIMLDAPLLSHRIRLRYRVTGELLDQAGVSHQTVVGEGNSALSQVMSLVLLGDYMSYYLAMLYRIDPSPVKAIDYLKGELAKG